VRASLVHIPAKRDRTADGDGYVNIRTCLSRARCPMRIA